MADHGWSTTDVRPSGPSPRAQGPSLRPDSGSEPKQGMGRREGGEVEEAGQGEGKGRKEREKESERERESCARNDHIIII